MGEPRAFLLTWRTYGTWLPGDERGTVDDAHNVYNTPFLPRNDGQRRRAAESMRCAPLTLTDEMRDVVGAAIENECAYRHWELLERAVRTNHVHVVVGFAIATPERMLQNLKARATCWLRTHGLLAPDRPVWADRPGSRRYLWTPEQVNAACAYVREGQDTPR